MVTVNWIINAHKILVTPIVLALMFQLFAFGIYTPAIVSPCSMVFPTQVAALLYKADTFSQACLLSCR